MLDLTDPINNGFSLPLQNTSHIALASAGSPTGVPVPWASTYATVTGSTLTSLYVSIISFF